MQVTWVTASAVERHAADAIADLMNRDDGFLWVDLMATEDGAHDLLANTFAFHPRAVHDCVERNHIPKHHLYRDYLFVVLHAPEPGQRGHVHYLELDQFVSERYLVTVHGPLNPAVDPALAVRETTAVQARMEGGRFSPASPFHLSQAIVGGLIRHQEAVVADLARASGEVEKLVMAGSDSDPQVFLEGLFNLRQQLLAVRTISTLSATAYGRLTRLGHLLPPVAGDTMETIADEYSRVAHISEGQMEFVRGVTELYQAQTNTKISIAAERLAVIAAVTLPVTAIASIMGMNVIVNEATHTAGLIAALVAMLAISTLMLIWARRQGWW